VPLCQSQEAMATNGPSLALVRIERHQVGARALAFVFCLDSAGKRWFLPKFSGIKATFRDLDGARQRLGIASGSPVHPLIRKIRLHDLPLELTMDGSSCGSDPRPCTYGISLLGLVMLSKGRQSELKQDAAEVAQLVAALQPLEPTDSPVDKPVPEPPVAPPAAPDDKVDDAPATIEVHLMRLDCCACCTLLLSQPPGRGGIGRTIFLHSKLLNAFFF
jgi:hypothetical protein